MQLASIFTNNMVFQANRPIFIFGTGKGNLSISFQNQEYKKYSSNEKWLIELPAQNYGGPYNISINLNGEVIILNNIMIGEVYLCAGQSNMQFEMQEEKYFKNEKGNSSVRYFFSDRLEKHSGLTSKDGWIIANKENLSSISALAYHIANNISKKHKIPVGIVGCFQGASVIRSWIAKDRLTQDVFIPLEQRDQASREPLYSSWNLDAACYQYTFLPLVPFQFSNVIWYQGESDSTIEEGKVYFNLLNILIKNWRDDLKNNTLPFIIIQICDFDIRADEGWLSIQQAQLQAASIPYVNVVESSDVCEHTQIHPSNKRKLANKVAKIIKCM